MNELEIAREIAAGRAPSPSPCGAATLWAMRITGTGRAERAALGETTWRDPGTWLNPETIERCAGLPVIWDHPPSGLLDSDSFASRVVGNVLMPYIAGRDGIANEAGPDLWAIAVIRDDAANAALRASPLSTSPAVAFKRNDGSLTFETSAGETILLEGVPALLDHLAICERGVWDKGGEPSGIRHDLAEKESIMADPNDLDDDREDGTAPPKPGVKQDGDQPAGDMMGKLLIAVERLTDLFGNLSDRVDAIDRRATAVDGDDTEAAVRAKLAREGETKRVAADSYVARQDRAAAEMSEMRQSQARADQVHMALGNRAPAPLSGERPLAYRRRLARGLQRYSSEFKRVNLEELPAGEAFDAIETRVYADALEAARRPEVIPGVLREIRKRDFTGREIIEFVGDDTFIGLMRPNAKRVMRFNTPRG